MSDVPYGVVKLPNATYRFYCKEGVSMYTFGRSLGPEKLYFEEDFYKGRELLTMVIPEELIR